MRLEIKYISKKGLQKWQKFLIKYTVVIIIIIGGFKIF